MLRVKRVVSTIFSPHVSLNWLEGRGGFLKWSTDYQQIL